MYIDSNMTKTTDTHSITESATGSSTLEDAVDSLLRLSRDSKSRRGESEADRKARTARERGWTRDELYERGSLDAD